jgi:hypothetical protein
MAAAANRVPLVHTSAVILLAGGATRKGAIARCIMKLRMVFAVVLPLVLIGVLVGLFRYSNSAAAAQVSTPDAIPSPTEWVPFDASMRKVSPKEGTMEGRYYRRSDGSTRFDTGPTINNIRVISISNVANSEHYELTKGTWKSYRMILPPEGYRPGARSFNITRGLEAWPEAVQGFEVVRLTTEDGLIRFQAPALNFFNLLTEFQGTRQEFFDVRLREQPRELFFPPRDVEVEKRPEYNGIVSERGAAAAGIAPDSLITPSTLAAAAQAKH